MRWEEVGERPADNGRCNPVRHVAYERPRERAPRGALDGLPVVLLDEMVPLIDRKRLRTYVAAGNSSSMIAHPSAAPRSSYGWASPSPRSSLQRLRHRLLDRLAGRLVAEGPDLAPAIEGRSWVRELHVMGPVRDLAPVIRLPRLEILALRSVRMGDLAILAEIPRLRNVQLRLGSVENLEVLAELPQLDYLEVWQVRGVADLSVLGRLTSLQALHLHNLPHVHTLPDLSRARHLRRVHLQYLHGLHDLSPLASAPALEEVLLVAFRHLQPEQLAPLASCPSLRRVDVGLGSDRKNRAARDLLQLPGGYGGFEH